MSRASKYLRKKLQEGGTINPEEAAKKAMAQLGKTVSDEQPQFSPGIMLGGQVPQNRTQLPTQASMMEKLSQASSERSQPQAVSEELEAQLGQKPSETVDLGQELRRSPGIMQPAVIRSQDPRNIPRDIYNEPIAKKTSDPLLMADGRLSDGSRPLPEPEPAQPAPTRPAPAPAPAPETERDLNSFLEENESIFFNDETPIEIIESGEATQNQKQYLRDNNPEYMKLVERQGDSRGTDTKSLEEIKRIEAEHTLKINQKNWLATNNPEYKEIITRIQNTRGNDAEAVQRKEEIEAQFAEEQKRIKEFQDSINQAEPTVQASRRPPSDEPIMPVEGPDSDSNVTSVGSVKDVTPIPKPTMPTPPEGKRPVKPKRSDWGAGSRGDAGYNRAMGEYKNALESRGWNTYDAKIIQYNRDNAAYLADQEERKNNPSGYNTMADNNQTVTTGGGVTVGGTGSGGITTGAPTNLQITAPTYEIPQVETEDVDMGMTTTNSRDVQRLDEARRLTGQAVTADVITDSETAIQRKPEEVTAPEDVTAASMEAAIIGQEMPERPKASDYDRTTVEGRQKYSAALAQFDSKLERIRGYERPQPQDYKGGQNDPDFRAAIEAFRKDPLPTTKAVQAAQGEVSEAAQAAEFEAQQAAQVATAQRDAEAEAAAQADAIEYDASQDAYVNKVTGKVATVEETTEAEAKSREAITGMPAPDGEAAQIMSMYDFNQSQQRAIQGQKAKDKAIKQLKAQGVKDDDIAQQLADNPELIADQMEDLPEDVRTTLSGLPQEALVSVQMESLMAGMEDGEVPMWARPALAKVEANLAKRGMGKSSVGRDALFNAIIQSAIPLAQSNAAAIQQATAQDKQIAADFLAKNAGFQQQMELANLSNDQQMRLANLSAQNQADSESLSNAQQTELANLNARMQTNLLQGKIAAEMNQAQLNVDQQRAVTNASMVANIDMAKFNAAQQVELANSKFMQSMVQTQFNADQQAAIQNATMQASLDLATLGANEKLRAQNAQAFLQMDMANLSNEQQAAVLTAQQRQQALLSNQAAENAAAQFNAANEQQANQFMANLATTIQQFNVQSNAAREQFNATESNRIAAINAGNTLQADQFEAQLFADIAKFNEAQDFQRDQWNASNAQAVEQSNIQWRRQANLAETAAQNAANQQNAQIAYNLTSQELSQVWQQLRDQAAYIRQSFENEQQRKAQLLATAIGNEKLGERTSEHAKHTTWLRELSEAI